MRKYLAEALGTLILVFFGAGSAVFGNDKVGAVGVAFAFGFVLLALIYAIGPVSNCHVNPAITLGALLAGRINVTDAVGYWLAQVLGAVVAGALLKIMVVWGGVTDKTGALGTNSWGRTVNGAGAFLIEVIMTFVLVLVVLLVTGRTSNVAFAGLAIGIVLVVVHLVGIPLTGTSVNPARSIGPALFAGADAIKQLWLFILAPLIGGGLAALAAPSVSEPGVSQPAPMTS